MSVQPASAHHLNAALARECAAGLPSDRTVAAIAGHGGVVILATAGAAGPDADGGVPQPVGTTDPDGRHLVHVFSDLRRATAFATRSLDGDRREVMATTVPWLDGMRYLLHTSCAGILIDDGTDDRTVLDRRAMAHVLAGLALEPLLAGPEVLTVMAGGHLHVECPDGAAAHAFVCDSPGAADVLRQMIDQRGLALTTAARPTASLLLALQETGIACLDVNRALPDAYAYFMEDVLRVAQRVQRRRAVVAVPAGPQPTAESEGPGDPAAHDRHSPRRDSAWPGDRAGGRPRGGGGLAARASRRSTDPPVPPVHRSDADGRAFFREWREVAVSQALPTWRFLEAMASVATFYVPRATAPVEGRSWPWHPVVGARPDAADSMVVHLFTSEAAARAAIGTWPRGSQRVARLSGLEAFRWIWAFPGLVTDIAIDYPDREGWLLFPRRWLQQALFPLAYETGELSLVPQVPADQLGMLPGARALRPEVVRSLIDGWRNLLDVEPRADGRIVAIERDGRRFMPAFSSRETFAAFLAAHRDLMPMPRPPASRPPFDAWLSAVADLDGVLLDPATHAPIVLDHTALLVLELSGGRPSMPDATSLVREARYRFREHSLSPTALARLVAEVPEYWLGALATSPTEFTLLRLPDDDATGLLFTSEQTARAFFTAHPPRPGAAGGRGGPATVTLLPRHHTWFSSPILDVVEACADVVVDPSPDGSGGLRLSGPLLQLVVDALDERLRPRVPGFVWEE